MKRLPLIALCLLGALSARAQVLVSYDARALVPDENTPHIAVLTEEDYRSPAWFDLEQRIDRYAEAQALSGDTQGADDTMDFDSYIRELETLAKQAEQEGNKEAAASYRQSIKEAREIKALTEQQYRDARAAAEAGAKGLDGKKLLAELLEHAVGKRLFNAVGTAFPALATVYLNPKDEDLFNGWGVMDAKGKRIIPCQYYTIATRYDDDGSRLPLIVCFQEVDRWKDLWKVDLYREDGTLATRQQLTGAKIFTNNVLGVRFPDGTWGLMNKDCRVLTTRKYKTMDTNVNSLIDSEQGWFVYGERDGVNYILSQEDGSEIGTFRMTDSSYEVNYYPGRK